MIDVRRDGDIVFALHEVDVRLRIEGRPRVCLVTDARHRGLDETTVVLELVEGKRGGRENLIEERGRGPGNVLMRSVPRGMHHTTEDCVKNVLTAPISVARARHVDHPSAMAVARACALP